MMKNVIIMFVTIVLVVVFSYNSVADLAPAHTQNCSTYEEYCQYLDKSKLSANFVPFERISFVGDFEKFWHHFPPNDAEQFGYTLRGDEGVLYFKDVASYNHEKDLLYNHDVELLSNPSSDLTSCGKSGNYYRRIGNCIYVYRNLRIKMFSKTVLVEGYLDHIYVECDEWLVRWQMPSPRTEDSDLSSFSEDSFLYQMLNLETAEAAGERLVSAINGEPKERVSLIWIALPVGAVVIVGGAAFFLLRKKRRD